MQRRCEHAVWAHSGGTGTQYIWARSIYGHTVYMGTQAEWGSTEGQHAAARHRTFQNSTLHFHSRTHVSFFFTPAIKAKPGEEAQNGKKLQSKDKTLPQRSGPEDAAGSGAPSPFHEGGQARSYDGSGSQPRPRLPQPPPAPGLLEASLCKRERGPAELRRIPRRAAGAAQQLVNCSWPRACQQLAAGARFARSAARGAAQPRAGTASPRDAFKPCGKGGSRAANCCRVLYVTARGKDSRERRQLYCPHTEKTVMAGATGLTWLHGWWKLQNEVANNCMLLLLAAFFFFL